MRLKSSVALLPLLVLACSHAFAEPPIQGTVRNAKGEGIEGVSVTLYLRSQGPRISSTDSKGEYKFDGLATGSYELMFELEGFTTVTRRVDLTYDDDSGRVDVTLVPASTAPAQPPCFSF
ncbi:MAG: carboxypeptidase-like regulatory domain-containing protein [Bryobacteraceae bacterium]|jgi:hypothetical protein